MQETLKSYRNELLKGLVPFDSIELKWVGDSPPTLHLFLVSNTVRAPPDSTPCRGRVPLSEEGYDTSILLFFFGAMLYHEE